MIDKNTRLEAAAEGTAAPKVLTIEGEVVALCDGPRHIFDFEYQGKKRHCFIVSRLLLTEKLHPGQTVVLTGEWSTAVLNVFEALVLATRPDT